MKYRYMKIKYSANGFSTKMIFKLIFSLLFYSILFYFIFNNILLWRYFMKTNSSTDRKSPLHHDGYVVDTASCKIPDFHPFDERVKRFIVKPQNHICNDGKPALLASNLTSIYVITASLAAYNISDKKLLHCSYNGFFRRKPKIGESDTKINFSGVWYNFTESINVGYEFIRTVCYYNNVFIYEDMFAFVPITNIKYFNDFNHPQPLNVLVLGIDSVSRLNLHRQMPKTVNYLKNLGAIELLGYNKVADNTFPNLIPVLTGLTVKELNEVCTPETNDYFDGCPFVWNLYKDKGYITAYGEDTAHLALFTYGFKGFQKQPTDFYYSHFSRYTESTIGNNFHVNTYICEGSRYVYQDFINYIKKFVYTMENNMLPYFSFFWEVSLSHDDLNYPNKGDEDYSAFFEQLKNDNILENTAVVFMSDHGIRFGGIRETYQGRLEERLPFLFILLPQWFKNKYAQGMNNLIENTRRLTTPFDLHETLKDLVYQENILIESNFEKSTRGYSLFNRISENRTCEQAGILSHWCTCQENIDIETNASLMLKSARFVVNYINQLLANSEKCAYLELLEIKSATLRIDGNKEVSKVEDYTISFVTVPGNAIFEATVRHTDNELKVVGTISRLNLYAGQSYCIDDNYLKMYCFCL